MFLSTLVRRLEILPDRDAVLREAIRQLQDWLGVESSMLRAATREDVLSSTSQVRFLEAPHSWICRIRVAEHVLEFRHPSPPQLSPSDVEGLAGFALFLEELLDSKELSPELFSMEEQVQGLIDTSLHLIAVVSLDGRVEKIHSRDASTQVGSYLWDTEWLKDKFRDEVQEAIERVRGEGNSSTLQIETSNTNFYELTLYPLADEHGEVSALIARGRDVTERHRMRQVLLEEREFLRAVLESIDEAIVVCNLEGHITLVNGAASRRFGLNRDALVWENLSFLGESGQTLPLEESPLGRILGGEKLREAKVTCLDVDGEVRLMLASGCRLLDSEQKPYGAVVALHDTTRRRQAENALFQSERRLRALFNSQPSVLLSLDSDGTILRCNPAVETLLGFSPPELEGCPVTSLFDTPIDDDLRFHGERELKLRKADGGVAWGLATTVPVRDAEGDLGVMWIITDISKQKATQAELDLSNRKLAESREMERTRLARELHDGAVQNLLAVSYRMKDRVLREEVVQVVSQLRALISDLRPPGLKEFGLEAAIEGLLAKMKRQAAGDCGELLLKCKGLQRVPDPVAICLFRVVQEAVTNVFRHARASRASIFLEGNGESVRLQISDDGVGFALPEDLTELAGDERFGLAGLKERVELVKGQFFIRSAPGEGTQLEVLVPTVQDFLEPI